jgi:hypothetical protein
MPVSYSWNNGSTIDSIGNLRGGTYSCIISDASGKSFTVFATVVQPSQLLANPVVNNACTGTDDSVWLSPTGGTVPYAFLWNNGSTEDTLRGLPAGIDTCIVTDAHGCKTSSIVTLANPAPLKIDSVVSTRPTCDTCLDGTATVYTSGGIPPGDSNIGGYTLLYLWTYGGDSATVHGIPSGIDSITVSNACGSVIGYTNVPMGIKTLNANASGVKIYPVPTRGLVSIYMNGTGFEAISIEDEFGREVYRNSLDANQHYYTLHPNLENLPNGIYIVRLLTQEETITRKLVLEK